MARFDPHTYPDRLAFEAHARDLRSAEFGHLAVALRTWFRRMGNGIAAPRMASVATVRRALHR